MMKLKKNLVIEEIEHQFVIYDNDTSKLHEINEMGNFILREIGKRKNEGQILNSVCQEYDTSKIVARRDIKNFIKLLKKEGLVYESG